MNSPGISKGDDSGYEGVPSSSSSISSIKKYEYFGPAFKLVAAYDKNNVKAVNRNDKVNDYSKPIPVEDSKQRGDLYADTKGPTWQDVPSFVATRPIIGVNLSQQFKDLPIFGAPECSAKLEDYQDKLIREFSCVGLDDTEYKDIKFFCNFHNIRTGKEIKMPTSYPVSVNTNHIVLQTKTDDDTDQDEEKKKELRILKKVKIKQKITARSAAAKLLKYRGYRQLPLKNQEERLPGKKLEPPDLEPGIDVLYRMRIFRPFSFLTTGEKHVRGRHSVFDCDLVALGQLPLWALRERFPCRNDADMRIDRSEKPADHPLATAKALFPSGFFFINNVFYVDRRRGCRDTSEEIRKWASARGLGTFPVRDMDVLVQDALVRLGHPEVYMHQGNCEHLFVFSEARLLGRSDPLHRAAYPCHTLNSQHQSVYCTTCAEYIAKWLVTGTDKVPFNPAFFCGTCFKVYLYKDGKKIGNFKAYSYKGNELYNYSLEFGNPNP